MKSGDFKVFIVDTKTGEKEEIYKDEIRISLEQVNKAVGNFRLSKLASKKPKRSIRIRSGQSDISKYRGKEVEILFVYKASGINKATLFLDDVSVK